MHLWKSYQTLDLGIAGQIPARGQTINYCSLLNLVQYYTHKIIKYLILENLRSKHICTNALYMYQFNIYLPMKKQVSWKEEGEACF